jgi:hypothetical protein
VTHHDPKESASKTLSGTKDSIIRRLENHAKHWRQDPVLVKIVERDSLNTLGYYLLSNDEFEEIKEQAYKSTIFIWRRALTLL